MTAENRAEEHAAVALVAAKKKHSVEKTNNLFSVFDSTDGALYASSNPMATSLFYDFHGNPLLLAWRQPSTVRLSIICSRIRGLGMPLRSSDELDNVMEAEDAGGRTADERQHQTLLRSPQKMPDGRHQLCRALDTLACFGRWRTLAIYLGISLYDGRLDVVLIATVLAKLGIDQLLTYASLCWRTRLSLLSPPLLYAQLDPKL